MRKTAKKPIFPGKHVVFGVSVELGDAYPSAAWNPGLGPIVKILSKTSWRKIGNYSECSQKIYVVGSEISLKEPGECPKESCLQFRTEIKTVNFRLSSILTIIISNFPVAAVKITTTTSLRSILPFTLRFCCSFQSFFTLHIFRFT